MTHAAIYTRVSTDQQDVEMQVNACKRWCDELNWTYDIYVDKISGSTTSRPDFDRMMAGFRLKPKSEYQAIVLWKLDRLGRSTIHLLQLMEEFRNKNIQIVCTTQHIDTGTPEGRLFFSIIASFAELEREYTKMRVTASLKTKRERGITLGRPKGSKDKRPRSKLGYIAAHMKRKRKGESYYQQIKREEMEAVQAQEDAALRAKAREEIRAQKQKEKDALLTEGSNGLV